MDSALRFITPTPKHYSRFANLVTATAKKCIRKGYRKEYIPCWNEDSDRLYAEFQENDDSETAKELLESLDNAGKQRWTNTVESLDLTRPSRKGWALIRKLGGVSKLNIAKPKINVDRMARKIIRSSKVPPNKQFTKDILKAYRELRKATPTENELSRPFSVEDVNTALLYMKNGKASGFDSIYTEFLT